MNLCACESEEREHGVGTVSWVLYAWRKGQWSPVPSWRKKLHILLMRLALFSDVLNDHEFIQIIPLTLKTHSFKNDSTEYDRKIGLLTNEDRFADNPKNTHES